jgi:hypothetical protein
MVRKFPESGGMGYLLNYGILNSDPGIWSRARVRMRATCERPAQLLI